MTKKQQNKIISIAEILEKKDKLKQKKAKTARLYVDSLESEIVIKVPDRKLAFELISMAQEGNEKADAKAVYECVVEPDLKSKQLQEGFGVFEPMDVIDELFTAGEVGSISGHILQLAGFGQGVRKVDDDLKN
jgi:hypothetical protein